MLEELGSLFKGDPTFQYIFQLPKGLFLEIVKLRKKRVKKNPPLILE